MSISDIVLKLSNLGKSGTGGFWAPEDFVFVRTESSHGSTVRQVSRQPSLDSLLYDMPPGVPRDRVRAVEAAFLKTLKDPEFVAEAEKSE
jgi:hypothetical protein